MTDLLKAAQAVIDNERCELRLYDAIETLRQAAEQAKGVEAVGTICLTPVVFNHDANIFECIIQYELPHKPKQGDLLYTTPPSIDAPVEPCLRLNEYGDRCGHCEPCTKLNRKWQAYSANQSNQPNIDALIAEIDGIDRHGYSEYGMIPDRDGDWIDIDELKAILDKYRSAK